jgi:hypothetical protein
MRVASISCGARAQRSAWTSDRPLQQHVPASVTAWAATSLAEAMREPAAVERPPQRRSPLRLQPRRPGPGSAPQEPRAVRVPAAKTPAAAAGRSRRPAPRRARPFPRRDRRALRRLQRHARPGSPESQPQPASPTRRPLRLLGRTADPPDPNLDPEPALGPARPGRPWRRAGRSPVEPSRTKSGGRTPDGRCVRRAPARRRLWPQRRASARPATGAGYRPAPAVPRRWRRGRRARSLPSRPPRGASSRQARRARQGSRASRASA